MTPFKRRQLAEARARAREFERSCVVELREASRLLCVGAVRRAEECWARARELACAALSSRAFANGLEEGARKRIPSGVKP